MIYVGYFLLIAVIFGLIALGDFLLKRLLPKPQYAQSGNVVRMGRFAFIIGLMICIVAVVGLLYVPFTRLILWICCWIVLVMGAFVLTYYFRVGIFYDEEGFTYRTLTGKARSYRYSQIKAQQSFLAKSGWNSALYLKNGDEVPLSAAMQDVDKFLRKAFSAWCKSKNIDPDTVENNPSMLVFFPPLEEEVK